MGVVNVHVVGRQVFDKDIQLPVLYYLPNATAHLMFTSRKQVLWVVHVTEYAIVKLTRARCFKEQNPS